MASLARYKKCWDRRAIKEKALNEHLRVKAIKSAYKLKDILVKEFAVKKVILFGSVIEKGSFKEDSDIDFAVVGLSKKKYFTALGRLIMESPFNVDIKPIEDASELLKQRIKRGKVIYEKRKNS